MLFQDDDATQVVVPAASNLDDFYAAEEDIKQNSNNARENSNKIDTGVNEKTRYDKL